jgi:hypothetical protein
LNGCGIPITGAEGAVAVTDGFVSVSLTANINEPEEVEVKNAAGQTCVRDAGCSEFVGYNVDITFCNVDPNLFSMLTGQDVVADASGNAIGFRMNSKKKACDSGFALEMWAGSQSADACDPAQNAAGVGQFGYVVLPFLRAGVIGDFTIENAAVTFTVSGGQTLDGNSFQKGWYPVFNGSTADAQKFHEALDSNDHLAVAFTTLAPPDNTDGKAGNPPYEITYDEYLTHIATEKPTGAP